jgi:hypothetical protein
MSPKSVNEYTAIMARRYKNIRKRSQKNLILNEYCRITGYHRKHAIRKLNTFKFFTQPRRKKPGRPSRYNHPEILLPLKTIWLQANLPCSKILKVIVPIWLPHYAQTYHPLDLYVIKALKAISPAMIDRLLKPIRPKYKKRGLSCTKPGSLLRNQIPIKTNQWDEFNPGCIESDTVHHCGESPAGQYVLTVDYDDIATGWTEQRAVWGKGESGVMEQTKDVEQSLPFAIRGFDCDNGGEYINEHLYKYFTGRSEKPVQFTRSRAYHSNDNSHVEQKNWTHVRQWIGYGRFDKPEIVPLLNDLYKNEWRLYHNFFIPSVKLIEKKRVGSKTVKRYDKPKTPFQRVIEADSDYVSNAKKRELQKLFESLNPFELRNAMEKKIAKILKIASAE